MRARRERRIRARGRPASATVVAVRPREGGWLARVRVEAAAGDPFEADLELSGAGRGDDDPREGDRLEVLHDRRHVVPLTDPPFLHRPAPSADAGPEPEPRPPAPEVTLGRLLRHLADGSLTGDMPAIVLDDDAGRSPLAIPAADPAMADLATADLIGLARTHTGAVADEVLRRIAAGATTMDLLMDEARAAGPAGAGAVRAVLDDLQARGLLGDRARARLDPGPG